MATVKKRGKAWQATIRGPDGKERTKTWAKKVDAERWANTQEADKARGTWIDPTAGRVTFGHFARQWAASQLWQPATTAGVGTKLEHHLIPQLGDIPMASLRPSQLQTWLKGRSEVLAPSTVRALVQTLRSILKAAVADRIIAASPADRLRLPPVEQEKVKPLEVRQVAAVRAAMPPRYRASVTLAAGAGLRQGELFGLTVDGVDWLRRTITVDRQLVTITGKGASLAPPKTASSVRTIPVPDGLLQALSAHIAAYPPGRDGLLFTTGRGNPVARQEATSLWRRAADRADVKGASWHDLRHYYASVLIRAGESVKVVQERLGHTSAAMTLDVYSHLWASDDDRTRAAVEDALGTLADISRTAVQSQVR
jgi:integrase